MPKKTFTIDGNGEVAQNPSSLIIYAYPPGSATPYPVGDNNRKLILQYDGASSTDTLKVSLSATLRDAFSGTPATLDLTSGSPKTYDPDESKRAARRQQIPKSTINAVSPRQKSKGSPFMFMFPGRGRSSSGDDEDVIMEC